jgi:hypothetical protein
MDSRELIDAQFDRAVEIVQGLPKTGPIQTGYEEKLTMYRCATRPFISTHTFTYWLPACISKVDINFTSYARVSLTYVTVHSDSWQCSRHSSGHVGYAREGEVVSSSRHFPFALSRVNEHTRDAWAKHKDLDPYESKWFYVDALLKVRSSIMLWYQLIIVT